MPIHDWTRVDAGIFHHFHQRWIVAIADVLNEQLLPSEYYALAEQHGSRFEPDILTLKTAQGVDEYEGPPALPTSSRNGGADHGGALLTAEPNVQVTAETDLDYYRRKQNVAAIRHVSGDTLVALVEVVSKGNKSGRAAFEGFVRKAADFLDHQIHLLILDLQPPTARDPNGIHGALWEDFTGQSYIRPADKPLTLASYESASSVRAFIEPIAVGDSLVDMPLYLAPGQYVSVPLEETYRTAFGYVPLRWRTVLERGG